MASNNKFEQLVEETVVEVAPIIAVAARAIGGAGKSIARGILGKPAPVPGARNAAKRHALSNRKFNAGLNRSVGNSRANATRNWLKANDTDQAAKIAKETIRNNKGTGGSNVVTSGNKTTNHTSNYNQVRKKDLQNYSATKQGQPPVKDDESDNPRVTNTSGSSQGSSTNAKSAKKTSVSGKFRAKVGKRAGITLPDNVGGPKPPTNNTPPASRITLPPNVGPTDGSAPRIADDSPTTEPEAKKSNFRSRVASNAKATAQGVTNVILKHLTPGS